MDLFCVSVRSQTKHDFDLTLSSSSLDWKFLKTADSTTNIYLIESKFKQELIEKSFLCFWAKENKSVSFRWHSLASIFCPSDSSFSLLSDSESESGSHKSVRGKQSGPSDGKPTRVRTVLNEKQLHTLR